jgi:Tfp pilus assembly protein PilF
MKKQDWTQAQASLTKAIEIAQEGGKSPSPRYVYGRAQAFENLGELEKSQADYRLSCQLAKLGCDKVSG